MMDDLVVHPLTLSRFQEFITTPRHALQIVGTSGIGKATLAQKLAAELLGLPPEKLSSYAYYLHITPEKQTISIETIRASQHFLQRQTPGTKNIRRVIILEDAHTMTTEAQN